VVSLDFSVIYSFWPFHGRGVDWASSENEYQDYFLGVKATGACGWPPHHLHVPNVMEICEPKPPGTLCATPGLLRDSFTYISCNWGLRTNAEFSKFIESHYWAKETSLLHWLLHFCGESTKNVFIFRFCLGMSVNSCVNFFLLSCRSSCPASYNCMRFRETSRLLSSSRCLECIVLTSFALQFFFLLKRSWR
jgi:hypothetical protein